MTKGEVRQDPTLTVEKLREVIHLAPMLAGPYLERSDLLLQLGMLNDAVENYKTATKNMPENSALHAKLALVLEKMADHEIGDQKFALLREACAERISASKLPFAGADFVTRLHEINLSLGSNGRCVM